MLLKPGHVLLIPRLPYVCFYFVTDDNRLALEAAVMIHNFFKVSTGGGRGGGVVLVKPTSCFLLRGHYYSNSVVMI